MPYPLPILYPLRYKFDSMCQKRKISVFSRVLTF